MIALTTKQAIRGLMKRAAKGKSGLQAIDAKRRMLVLAEDTFFIADDKSLDEFFDNEMQKLNSEQHKINLKLGLVQIKGSR